MSWTQALLVAVKTRSHGHVLRAVVIALPALVLGSFGQSLETGLMLGAWMFAGTLLVDTVDDARKARKAARS